MDRAAGRNWKRYVLWGIALSVAIVSVIRAILQYASPMNAVLPDVIALEWEARLYRLLAKLILICGLLCCGLIASWKGEKVTDKFLPMWIVLMI